MAPKIDEEVRAEQLAAEAEGENRPSRRAFTLGALGGVATLLIGCDAGTSTPGNPDAGGGDGDGDQAGDGDSTGDGDHPVGDGDAGDGDSADDGDAGDGDNPGDGDVGDGDVGDGDVGDGDVGDGDSASDGGEDLDCSEGDPPASSDDNSQPISCTVRPEQTEGPYFVDERYDRYDIRTDPENACRVSDGTELRLKLGVYDVSGGGCKPLKGAVVDIWHCDALGVYSDVTDTGGAFDTVGEKFLRGYQRSDDDGIVRFVTTYPGWYTGRSVHIHVKVRTDPDSQQGFEWTSQLYFEDSVTDGLLSTAPYASNTNQRRKNAADGIFAGDGGSQLIVQLNKDGNALVGEFGMGLQIS